MVHCRSLDADGGGIGMGGGSYGVGGDCSRVLERWRWGLPLVKQGLAAAAF